MESATLYSLPVALIATLPQWVVASGAFLAVVVGAVIGRAYWRQLRTQALMVELETRRAQSEFDLVSRDVIRTKQVVLAELAEKEVKL
ncbi:MAG: hypothetical protein P1V20_31375 [Verrucomicrobiales bacterium]|nr:hypothetical protein [Verrucomicrobiales bacterium]